jgi:hypothetical protein
MCGRGRREVDKKSGGRWSVVSNFEGGEVISRAPRHGVPLQKN